MAKGQTRDVYGNAPDRSGAALLIVDFINHLEFAGGDVLEPRAVEAAQVLARLRERARSAGIPTIFANDNFGRWRADLHQVVAACTAPGVRGRRLGRILPPAPDDYFVLKPKHSAFFRTTLETLLHYLGARTLIVAGIAGDNCVLQTAGDAYMRDYRLIVPSDCTASIVPADNDTALAWMGRVVKAEVVPAEALTAERLTQLQRDGDAVRGPAAKRG